MECALSQRASIPGSDLEILSPPKAKATPWGWLLLLVKRGREEKQQFDK